MILSIAGAFLVALGLFCGVVLVGTPLGWLALEPSLAVWVLFPALVLGGKLLFMIGAPAAQVRLLTRLTAALLWTLALVSVAVLVLSAASVLHPPGATLALWYVMAVGIVLGFVGGAMRSRSAAES